MIRAQFPLLLTTHVTHVDSCFKNRNDLFDQVLLFYISIYFLSVVLIIFVHINI